jgi:serine/threonine-protein kinase
MSNKIGRFEIQSEITHSAKGAIYKATDLESGQTVALKTLRLDCLGDQAQALVKQILEEAEISKVLNSHNIALLYGAGAIEDQFCASVEYVHGDSVAAMLARKEGFSVWDLIDVARQTCQGLDHARVHQVVHYSLEPEKIMVQWDGIVKILGFGISAMGALSAQASGEAPAALHYMSPEQLAGDPVDSRSNLFSLGAILYEMVTECKAFAGADADEVRRAILETTPTSPDEINRKVHPALSALIMKALSKAPDERYSCAQDLVSDLEKCQESPAKESDASKAPKPAAKSAGLPRGQAAAVSDKAVASKTIAQAADRPKAAAAAAGASGGTTIVSSPSVSHRSAPGRQSNQSSATVEPETESPRIAIDPLMGETSRNESRRGGDKSFSEIDELPPMKEVRISPSAPPPEEQWNIEARPVSSKTAEPQKPKTQPREAAKRAVEEVKNTPASLFMYSLVGALFIMLLVVATIAHRIASEGSEEDAPIVRPSQVAPAPQSSASIRPAPSAQASDAGPARQALQISPQASVVEPSDVSVRSKYAAKKKVKAKISAAPMIVPALVPGQLNVNSTPSGASISVDRQTDPAWVTPYTMPGLTPGQHTVVLTKPGYAAETRTIEVTSNGKLFLAVSLNELTASISAGSQPAGAELFIDGKDTGRLTPAQLSWDKPGSHTFLFRKQGYLDETATANLEPGQTVHLSPTLKPLGNADEVKLGGKLKRLFASSEIAGMGSVAIKTQPKGAQIAVNNRVLDKNSPVDFYLTPGTYVIDITLSGYVPVERVITVEKGAKLPLEEVLQRD